jgi:hypothetical protein
MAPIHTMCEYFRQYRNYEVAIFGPLLGLPDTMTYPILKRSLEDYRRSRKPEDAQFWTNETREIYKSLCQEDELAVSRVVDFFLSYKTVLMESYANPLTLIWDNIQQEHIHVVSPLFRVEHFYGMRSRLTIRNDFQYALFDQMITSNIENDREVFGTIAFSQEFVSSLPKDNQEQIIDRIVNHFHDLLDMHINEQFLSLENYHDALYSSFERVIGEKERISELIYKSLGKCNGERFFKILMFFGRYLDSAHFLKLLNTNVFTNYEISSQINYGDCEEDHYDSRRRWDRNYYDEMRREVCLNFFIQTNKDLKFTDSPVFVEMEFFFVKFTSI